MEGDGRSRYLVLAVRMRSIKSFNKTWHVLIWAQPVDCGRKQDPGKTDLLIVANCTLSVALLHTGTESYSPQALVLTCVRQHALHGVQMEIWATSSEFKRART